MKMKFHKKVLKLISILFVMFIMRKLISTRFDANTLSTYIPDRKHAQHLPPYMIVL